MAIRIRSIAFPFKRGSTSFPEEATNLAVIKASVVQIITTKKGERVMRPTFGCDAFSWVFESDSEDFQATVEREIRQSLSKWEPRIRVDDVTVSSNHVIEPGQILITIRYTVVTTGEHDAVSIAGG